jgi:anti-sigma B factor antagonist
MITHAEPPAGASPAPLPDVPSQRNTSQRNTSQRNTSQRNTSRRDRSRRRHADELGLSAQTAADGNQVVSVTGELDIATAEQAYAYLSDVIGHGQAPVSVDLAGVTFCDASGLGVLARAANLAREKGRQLRLTSARPSLLKIMRITGLDKAFPELSSAAMAV